MSAFSTSLGYILQWCVPGLLIRHTWYAKRPSHHRIFGRHGSYIWLGSQVSRMTFPWLRYGVVMPVSWTVVHAATSLSNSEPTSALASALLLLVERRYRGGQILSWPNYSRILPERILDDIDRMEYILLCTCVCRLGTNIAWINT